MIRINRKLIVALIAALLTGSTGLMAQETAATSPMGSGSTADHSKFEILQKGFTSGPAVTEACLSCHRANPWQAECN
jgi:hypothetical protein